MLLKWTANAILAGAALHLGTAVAQDGSSQAPPEPAGPPSVASPSSDADPARYAPTDEDRPQASGRVQAATQGLNIDDETRSRYRWKNGEWWFKTRSGDWKFYREGRWQSFDPTTYQPLDAGDAVVDPPVRRSAAVPRTFSGPANGYSYDGRTYNNDPGLSRYDGRPYGGSRYYDGRYDGRYYNPGINNPGYGGGYQGPYGTGYRGYNGYNPSTDRYYGRDGFGQPYSINGDRYRGGVIGSQIGGRIGGNAGAMIGGAIGADAAD